MRVRYPLPRKGRETADSHTYTDEYRRKWPTRDEARHAVVEFIESYHNRRRPHSTIGYRIPAEAMDGFFERTEPMLETAHEQAAGKLSKAA